MIRLATVFWLLLVTASGFAVYAAKYQVQGLEDELARTRRTTIDTDRQIRVLTAEWAYLNRPSTLAAMNQHFLSLVPIATRQLRRSVADIPMRSPAAAPEVAAAPPIAAPAAAPPPAVVAAAPAAAPPPRSLDDLIARVVASR
jgi:cell division protein FtsL